MKPYLLLIDINASWVRSLMTALPGLEGGTRNLHAWQVYSWSYWRQVRRDRSNSAPLTLGLTEKTVLVPGWTRFGRLSTAWLVWNISCLIRRLGKPELIIYTLPQYAGVARRFRSVRQVYYAYDAYRYYAGWNAVRIGSLEKEMLNACDMTFAISRQLQEDFRKLTTKPVFYSPNAANEALVSQVALSGAEKPSELSSLPGKIIGCVGQISESAYDWPLIEGLAQALPDFTFVFIGPLADDPPGSRTRIERILHLLNVRWLGPRPHFELGRYFAGFDICFGPYAITPLSQRRSPLRMYDYLATAKPILFTPINEVLQYPNYFEVGATVPECVSLIRKMVSPEHRVDQPARRRFLLDNTWEKRAGCFWERISETFKHTIAS